MDVEGPAGRAAILLVNKRAQSPASLVHVTVGTGGTSPAAPAKPPEKIEWEWKIVARPPERRFIEITQEGFFQLIVEVANGGMFRHKIGAAVVAVRRAGAIHAFDALKHFSLISEMMVPGSSYWNIGIGWEPGEVEKDEEGIRTMKVLGRNMAWLLRKIHAATAKQAVRA